MGFTIFVIALPKLSNFLILQRETAVSWIRIGYPRGDCNGINDLNAVVLDVVDQYLENNAVPLSLVRYL